MNVQRYGVGPRMSQGVFWNGLLMTSAQVAKDFDLDATAQTKQVLDKIDALVVEAGLSKEQILCCNIWLSDIADYAAFNAVWDAWISKEAPPARVCIETKFSSPKIKVEI